MQLVLNEEQTLLQQTAREFLTENSSLRRIRELRDTRNALGYSPDLWKQMAQLGWLGIPFRTEHGGAGLGYAELMVVLEEAGRGLLPEPIISNVLLAGTVLLLGATDAQRTALLAPLIAGDLRLALAYQEARSRYGVTHIETRAARTTTGWTLDGEKVHVLDGYGADQLIISARVSGAPTDDAGIGLFIVDSHAPGVAIEREWRIDSRNAAVIRLDNVAVGHEATIGPADAAASLLHTAVDRATIGLCAEMLGSMNAALEMTLDYLKTRTQFGVLIGSFQALKHRAAAMYIETELARSAVMAAHIAIDEGSAQVPQLASLAKARCSDAFVLIGNETVQMHGGIGMTDEHDAGFFLKRARVAEITFGDASYHRDRYAALQGY